MKKHASAFTYISRGKSKKDPLFTTNKVIDKPIHPTSFNKSVNAFLEKASLAMDDKHWRGKPSFRASVAKDLLLSEPVESVGSVLGLKSTMAAGQYGSKKPPKESDITALLLQLDKNRLDQAALEKSLEGVEPPARKLYKLREARERFEQAKAEADALVATKAAKKDTAKALRAANPKANAKAQAKALRAANAKALRAANAKALRAQAKALRAIVKKRIK